MGRTDVFSKLFLACAVAAAAIAWPNAEEQTAPADLPLVQPNGLQFRGSFDVPGMYSGGGAMSIGANNTLYVRGEGGSLELCQVAIPSLGGSSPVTGCQDVPANLGWNNIQLGGSLLWNGRLVASAYIFYDASYVATASHVVGQPNITGFGPPQRVGTLNPGFYAGPMAVIPAEWRTLLGGPAMTGQMTLSIITRTSEGPAAFAFNPDDVGRVNPVAAAPLVYYPSSNPLHDPSVQNSLYTRIDNMGGMAFPAGTRTLMFIGRHGTGTPCYGDGAECGDLTYAWRGEHAYPYRDWLWLYDANDLVRVRQGQLQPWQVRPYFSGELPGNPTGGALSRGGAAFDPVTRKLYVAGNGTEIHVYDITVGTGAPLPPPPAPPPSPPPPSGGISVSPTSVTGTVTVGSMPPSATLTVTTPGVAWSTYDTSPFYNATPTCAFGTCPSGSTTTLTPSSSFFSSATPGTYSHPLTVRASGLPDVIVPVTIVVQAASAPPPQPVDCVVSAWSAWQPTSSWSTCTNGAQSRTEQRTRTILTQPSGGGLACPALTETRTVTQSCTSSPTPVDCVVSSWSAWQPTSDWSTCSADGLQSRTEQRTRTVLTPPSGGGTSCPSLLETRTVTRTCTPPAPPPAEVCGDNLDNDGDGRVDEECAVGVALPGAPRKLSRQVRGSTVYLTWRSPLSGGTPAGYMVQAGTAPGATSFSSPVATTFLRVDNVAPGRYYVRVRAVNAAGTGPASNEVTVSIGCSGKPKSPSSLTSTVNGSQVTFTWVDPDGCNDTSYVVAVGSTSGASDLAQVTSATDTLSATAPPGTYHARVHAVSPQGGSSAASNEVQVVVGAGRCAPPMFGTNLQGVLTGRQVTLTWRPVSEAAAAAADDVSPISYVLQVGSTPGASNLGSYAMGRATGFTTVGPPGLYYVRIRPADSCGLGAASNEVVVHVR
jgi:hypothetical protein